MQIHYQEGIPDPVCLENVNHAPLIPYNDHIAISTYNLQQCYRVSFLAPF